jgi:hypothetical protein
MDGPFFKFVRSHLIYTFLPGVIPWIGAIVLLPVLSCNGNAISSNSSTSVPSQSVILPVIESINDPADSETALLQVKGYSTSAEVLRYTTGESITLNRLDLEYAVFIHSFYMSYTGKGFATFDKSVDNGNSTAVSLTVPYAWGYILTYSLIDGSKIQYNCSSDNIWYDTKDTLFKAPFSEEFRSILEELFIGTSGDNILSGVSIQPGAGEYLYRDNLSSTGIVLRAASVREGILEKDYMSVQDDRIYLKGEPCLLLTGQVESRLDQLKYMTMVARGFDSQGNETAHVLDHGPISGVISIELPPGGFGGFIIHLNAAPDLVRIELIPSNQLYDIPPP